MEYKAEGKYATEKEAKTDLATCAYAGKWKKAKLAVDISHSRISGCTIQQFWDAVRLRFLELGGEWLSQITKPAPIDWSAPVYPSIPKAKYREPQKVRFA